MPLVLQIDSGPRRGEQIALPPGEPVSVGRTSRADIAVADDTFLSGRHFQIVADEATCILRDLNSSNGTMVRDVRITVAELVPGDTFIAGRTQFAVVGSSGKEVPAPLQALSAVSRERLLTQMRTGLQPLYAVLDAAHDPRILATLMQHKSQYAWLFDQGTPPELASFAPYLVPLPGGAPVLESLVDMGWMADWGIYLTSHVNAVDLLAFLRRLLLADQPDGQRALLRFYDPRVLRNLVGHSTPRQWPFLFGAVQSYLLPGKKAQTATGFMQSLNGVEQSDIFLDGSAPTLRQTIEVRMPAPGERYPPQQRPPSDRLVLTKEQMDAFVAQQRDPFAETLLQEMCAKYPQRLASLGQSTMAEWVAYGCKRPKRYGMQSDADVSGYVSLMMQLGRDFDIDPALTWASDILKLRLDPTNKILRLTAAAKEYLASHGTTSRA